jgi:hypothetical protein
MGERGGGGGAKSNDREVAWSSINHSIVTGATILKTFRSDIQTLEMEPVKIKV